MKKLFLILLISLFCSSIYAQNNAIKMDFISLVNNTLLLTYERNLVPGGSLELSGGVVGIGIAERKDSASGILIRGGYKFIRHTKDNSRTLNGWYLKPEFDFATYKIYGFLNGYNDKFNMVKWAIMVVPGYQFIINKRFDIDIYTGIGIGKTNLGNEFAWPYGFGIVNKSFPLALSWGIRCGFAF